MNNVFASRLNVTPRALADGQRPHNLKSHTVDNGDGVVLFVGYEDLIRRSIRGECARERDCSA